MERWRAACGQVIVEAGDTVRFDGTVQANVGAALSAFQQEV
jgi:hypothetical protein